jgi:hypothetical protein
MNTHQTKQTREGHCPHCGHEIEPVAMTEEQANNIKARRARARARFEEARNRLGLHRAYRGMQIAFDGLTDHLRRGRR